jgi:cell division septation protein DedD
MLPIKKSLLASCFLLIATAIGILAYGQAPKPRRPRGAIPSPRHKLVQANRHVARAVPASFGVVPPQLSYWGNNVYGDCVSAEEAAAKAIYSLMNGGTAELFVPEQTLEQWAKAHGYLNGANLTDVMDSMAKDGLVVGSATYTDGPYESVDWTTDATLRSAIYQGPVKIGVAADQLQNVVGTTNGWIGTGFAADTNEDHCVSLCGYGSMSVLCSMLGVSVPSGANPSGPAYLLFTWDTVGIIDQASVVAITGEAWLRTPTTPQQGPTPAPTPTPPVPPKPTPTPVPPTPTPAPQSITVPAGTYTTPGFTLTPVAGAR